MENFDKSNCVYFLMGGNPIIQRELIIKNNLFDEIKNYNGLVIGFCAGAINLSKYSIITTDNDFEKSDYLGLDRIHFCIEPCYNKTESESALERRNNEINEFVEKYNTEVIAIPDESIIVVEDDKIFEYGMNYHFKIKNGN